jgi:hypothetical protein
VRGSLGCSSQNLLQNLVLLPVFYFEILFRSPQGLLLLWLWISAWLPKDLVETNAACQNISAWLPKDLVETSAICQNISACLPKDLVETSAICQNISTWLRKDLVETSALCHSISHSSLLNITRSRPVAPVVMAFVNCESLIYFKLNFSETVS